MTESFVDTYKNLIRAAEASVLDVLKLQEIRKSKMPIMLDDDGTRFPAAYPDIQVRESTDEGLYRQQVSVFCEGMLSLCKVSSFIMDSDSMKAFDDVFDIYRFRCPYESLLFLQEYKKVYKEVPSQVNSMYETLLRDEDAGIQKNGVPSSKGNSDALLSGILRDAVNQSVRKIKSSN